MLIPIRRTSSPKTTTYITMEEMPFSLSRHRCGNICTQKL
jgi:hypothetical protein